MIIIFIFGIKLKKMEEEISTTINKIINEIS